MNRSFDAGDAVRNTAPECGLEEAIELLREDVTPRAEWRERLERELAMQAAPVSGAGYWRIRPLFAIAAGLLCMVIGSGATALIKSESSSEFSAQTPAVLASNSDSLTGAIGVRFAVMAQGATRVSLVGDFNGWNPEATPLRLANDGRTWVAMLPLREGRHTYAFVIDG